MSIRRRILLILAAGAFVGAHACSRAPEKLSPEAARAKGDQLLKEMSTNLAALKTLAYSADERREVVKGGAKSEKRVTKRIIMRRPSALSYTSSGEGRSGAAWYDGKQLTLVWNHDKAWARGPMPPTLDEALDFLSTEYAIQMPSADLLYASPYDAMMTPETTGGWVGVEQVGDRSCDHLAYKGKTVDWEIWLEAKKRLPCQLRIVHKQEPGAPATTVVYTQLDEAPQVSDDTFVAKIPDGYQRITIMRHATVAAPTPQTTSGPAAKP